MWVKSVNSTIFFWHAQKLRQGVYFRDFSIVIYGKFNCNFPVLFCLFFIWSVNCLSHFFSPFLLVSKLYELNSDFRDAIVLLWPVLILEIFSCCDIKKGQFQFWVIFLVVFFWSVIYLSRFKFDVRFKFNIISLRCGWKFNFKRILVWYLRNVLSGQIKHF